jgi:Tfp pilus assembly protein PilV
LHKNFSLKEGNLELDPGMMAFNSRKKKELQRHMGDGSSKEKGISLIEVLISLFLIMIGIFGLISMQPMAWRLSGTADYLGRAAHMLQKELQFHEARIMNPNVTIPVDPNTHIWSSEYEVNASGQEEVKTGDAVFNVQTTITDLDGGRSYRLAVRVSWPAKPSGISESLLVTRTESYRQ